MDKEKNDLLKEILDELADGSKEWNETSLEEISIKLQTLYSYNYRHLYSEIFAAIALIDGSCNETGKDISYIAQNIKLVYEHCERSYKKISIEDEFVSKVRKLYDHINLDYARIEYVKAIRDNNNKEIYALREKFDSSRENLEELQKQIEQSKTELQKEIQNATEDFSKTTENRIGKLQKDYVAILGIFASVVITFIAGISLANSALSALKDGNENFYTLSFLVILVAMFMFNALKALFDFLLKITDRKEKFDTIQLHVSEFNIIFVIFIVIDYICYLSFSIK